MAAKLIAMILFQLGAWPTHTCAYTRVCKRGNMDANVELSYGTVEIYSEETLGIGSYGKVCMAKYGQLPCAAKLLHDTMFGTNDPGINKFVERFEQECQFLKMIKHPNIVQFLGTSRDSRSKRLALLMELMDVSLTKFLEKSTDPLPYHVQLNICCDVALALAYLHSNAIIHRDLSSNNVLLIGKGSRAKVTDFGMSKLVGINPRMTTLTTCPGTSAYMPPEALITPPRYSSKLDCFSHGVLAIQIATRQFPNPGDSHVEDLNEGFFRQVPETERRKNDIDLVNSDHPLLPLALQCLKTKAADRPSADELCGRLATLQCDPLYKQSVEQPKEQNMSIQVLQQQIRQKDEQLERARQQIIEMDGEKSKHERELNECHVKLRMKSEQYKKGLDAKESMLEQIIADCQALMQEKTAECEENQSEIERLRKELQKEKQQHEVPKAMPVQVKPKSPQVST